jgi:hypothetical protein
MIEEYLEEILNIVKLINERTYRIEEKIKAIVKDKGMLK